MMEEGKPRIHVLMVAFASQGHINPMLRLGNLLQAKCNSIHVTLATTEVFGDRILAQRPQTSATTSDTNQISSISGIDIELFSDGCAKDYDRKGNLGTYMYTLANCGPINLYNLIMSLTSHPTTPKKFSCIINNPFVPWVADVAARVGVPCAMLWIQPCALFTIYYNYHNDLNEFPTKENPYKSVKLPGLPLLQTCDLPSFVLPSNPFGNVPKNFLEIMQNLQKLKWVFANSFYELEKDVIDSMSKFVAIKAVGPLVPPTLLGEECHNEHDQVGMNMWKPDANCIDWLNQNEPNSVIYVSFGSLVILSREQIEIIATALKISKRPFLWVMKEDVVNQACNNAGELPRGVLDEIKDQGMVVPWCPQNLVLSHKSVACFLTHCGWNSMLETISAGVPIIAYPMWSDQPTNAKLVSEVFGVGLRLRADKNGLVQIEEIVRCIEEIMDGSNAVEIRAKTVEWKRVARHALADGGSSDRNIQDFLNDIIQSSSHMEHKGNTYMDLAKATCL